MKTKLGCEVSFLRALLCLLMLGGIVNAVNGLAQGTKSGSAIQITVPVYQDSWLLQLKMGEKYAVPLRKKGDVVWYTFKLEDDLVVYLGQKGTADNKASIELLDQARKRIWMSDKTDIPEGSFCNEKLKKGTYFIKVTSIVFTPKPFHIEICKFSRAQTEEAQKQVGPQKKPTINPETDGWMVIDGKKVPVDFEVGDLIKLFGQPTRTNKTERWTIYINDLFGISCWTEPGSQEIRSFKLTLHDQTTWNPHAPTNIFTGSITIAGRKFPIGQPMLMVNKTFPEFKAIPNSFNLFHYAGFGRKEVSVVLDERGSMQSLGVGPPELAKALHPK